MDISKLKKYASDAKEKAKKLTNETLENTWKKILNSKATIKDKEWFDNLVSKSKNKQFTNKDTWETKTFTKRSMLIVSKEDSEFFKSLTYEYPVLVTKAFSQNIYLKLSKEKIDWVNFDEYWVESMPCILVFENEKFLKLIDSKENIQKLVKSINLDINKEIDLL